MSSIRLEAFTDLDSELTSGSDYECTDMPPGDEGFFLSLPLDKGGRGDFFLIFWIPAFAGMTGTELLDDRDGECCSLSCPCLCTAKQVESSEDDRDRLLLDRSRSRISLFFESLQDRWDELEF